MAAADTKITTYLEMTDPEQLQPKRVERDDLEIRQIQQPAPEFSWFLHQAVGAAHRWGGRETWGAREWKAHVDRPELETWVLYVSGAPAGYCELERHGDDGVRLNTFGLIARHIGQGLGGHFLTAMVERAWTMGASRVFLNTCTHDHDHALGNYTARGFTVIRTEEGPPNVPRECALFSRPNFG
tara:strand:+ start:178 stop:729 length:552 start_codon:yes stop_codon:yes gene_type:complete